MKITSLPLPSTPSSWSRLAARARLVLFAAAGVGLAAAMVLAAVTTRWASLASVGLDAAALVMAVLLVRRPTSDGGERLRALVAATVGVCVVNLLPHVAPTTAGSWLMGMSLTCAFLAITVAIGEWLCTLNDAVFERHTPLRPQDLRTASERARHAALAARPVLSNDEHHELQRLCALARYQPDPRDSHRLIVAIDHGDVSHAS